MQDNLLPQQHTATDAGQLSTPAFDPTHVDSAMRWGNPPAMTTNDAPSGIDGGPNMQAPPQSRHVFDTPTMINIECNKLASETTTTVLQGGTGIVLPPTITCPLPGSKANLCIGQTWITSHMHRHIHWEHSAYILRTYCLEKYGWNDEIFQSIAWFTIKTVRTRCTHKQQMLTNKIMHGWLPVMHMMSHMSRNSQCPGCLCSDETLDHVVRCLHPSMVSARTTILSGLCKQGQKRQPPARLS